MQNILSTNILLRVLTKFYLNLIWNYSPLITLYLNTSGNQEFRALAERTLIIFVYNTYDCYI